MFSNTRRAAAPGTLARRALLAKRNALSGSHAELIPAVLRELEAAGRATRPACTPKGFEVSRIMGDIVDVVADYHGVAAVP